jgi:hypothetical protein
MIDTSPPRPAAQNKELVALCGLAALLIVIVAIDS